MSGSVVSAPDSTPGGLAWQPSVAPEMQQSLMEWLAGGARGLSSDAIVSHLTGLRTQNDGRDDHPWDPADLRRCRLLLEKVPGLQQEFWRMATRSGPWAALVSRWQDLCEEMDRESPEWRTGKGRADRTCQRMRELTEEGRCADEARARGTESTPRGAAA